VLEREKGAPTEGEFEARPFSIDVYTLWILGV